MFCLDGFILHQNSSEDKFSRLEHLTILCDHFGVVISSLKEKNQSKQYILVLHLMKFLQFFFRRGNNDLKMIIEYRKMFQTVGNRLKIDFNVNYVPLAKKLMI